VYCLLGLESPNKSFLGIHRYLQTTLFKDYLIQLFGVWKWDLKKDMFSVIETIHERYLSKSTEFKCSFENILKSLSTCEDRALLREWVDEHFMVHENEKTENAEVATPAGLRSDMLNKVPVEFWMSPKKVLEPCCGKGGFLLDVIDLFMANLPIENQEERYKTILEKCLYFADINPLNIYICRLLLDPSKKYRLNLFEGDSLTAFGEVKFDLVVGNPPYNASGVIGSGNTLWQAFVHRSLDDWISEKGYLLFVHPPGWRKPESELSRFKGLFKKMTQDNYLIYLEIHGIKDGMKTFHCGTRYDWYLLQRTCAQQDMLPNTMILDEKGAFYECNLSQWEWLPNHSIQSVKELLATGSEERCPIIQSMSAYETRKSWMFNKQTKEFKHPCIHSTPKSGVRYMWSKLNTRGHFGVSKVIFGDSGIYSPVIDIKGQYGMTHHAMGIPIDNEDEGKALSRCLTSSLFKELLEACSWSNFMIDWRLFGFFKKTFYEAISQSIPEDSTPSEIQVPSRPSSAKSSSSVSSSRSSNAKVQVSLFLEDPEEHIELLETFTISSLKDICKQLKVKKYTTIKGKPNLIELMRSHIASL
jgi:hypothetical protein